MQAEIAQTIAAQIKSVHRPEPGSAGCSRAGSIRTRMKRGSEGTFFRESLSPENLEEGIVCFTRATSSTRRMRRRMAILRQAYFYRMIFGIGEAATMVSLRLGRPPRSAIELDPTIATAYIAFSAIHVFQTGMGPRGRQNAGEAVELSPGDPRCRIPPVRHHVDSRSSR